jgi:polyisoprenoid-binding protein YceI
MMTGVARVLVICALGALPASAQAPASTRIELTAGSTATYRVREQLARFNLPNDAVGVTSASGVLVIRPDGSFSPESALTADLRALKSDENRRDAWLRENTLHTDRFPAVRFVPRRHQGLPLPLPASGTVTFQLAGDMTLHGVTAEQSWNVTATLTPGAATGRATTRFQFAKFAITVPKLMGLISVEDDIRLEIDFKAKR